MTDPERHLERMKPAPPSENFERRMAALFEDAQPRPALWRRNIAAWQAVAACALCAFGGFGASRFLHGPAPAPVSQPEIRTNSDPALVQRPPVRSAFDLTDPTPFKAAASPAIQVIIETADWDDHS
jgi:hypothetical protein